jgi:hypothetical protein
VFESWNGGCACASVSDCGCGTSAVGAMPAGAVAALANPTLNARDTMQEREIRTAKSKGFLNADI